MRKGLFVFYGQAFRNKENSLNVQKEISQSHIKLLESLKGYKIDVLINSYKTLYEKELISLYQNHLICSNFIDDKKHQELFSEYPKQGTRIIANYTIDIINQNTQIEDYDFLFICRIDGLLKDKFIEEFKLKDKIMYPHPIQSHEGPNNKKHYLGNEPQTLFIGDAFVVIPKKYFFILEHKDLLHHFATDRLTSLNLYLGKDIDFFLHKCYSANTREQRNPFYRLPNRSEGSDCWRGLENLIFDIKKEKNYK
tara:strand:- start:35849 stop:36604 length:756 start_codon:yes stop_codon:yes gene_type:complete